MSRRFPSRVPFGDRNFFVVVRADAVRTHHNKNLFGAAGPDSPSLRTFEWPWMESLPLAFLVHRCFNLAVGLGTLRSSRERQFAYREPFQLNVWRSGREAAAR